MIKSRKSPAPVRTADTRALGLAMVSLTALNIARAAEPATPKPQVMQAVSVTEEVVEGGYKVDAASSPKYTQPLQDTPQTIQIINSELFNQQGATTLTEALRNSAGVGTFYAGENGNTSTGDAVYMRGFDTSSSIFADGIRDPGSISRDVFNMASVEVQKGPAGTDNGRSAPTGAINTVSKQAFLEDAKSMIVSAGDAGQRRVTGDWNLVNTKLAGSALRLNAMWQDSDVPGRDHVNNKRFGFASSAGFGIDTENRVFLNLYYVQQENVPDGFVPTIGLPRWAPQTGLSQLAGHPVDSRNFYGTGLDHDDSTARMATLRFEHDFSDKLRLTNTARWGDTVQDYLVTSYTVTGGTTGNPMAGNVKWTNINDLSTYTLARSNNNFKDQDNKLLTDQLNLRADFATGRVQHFLSTGVELTREDQNVHTVVAATGTTRPAANLYDPNWRDVGTLTWSRNGAGNQGRTDTTAIYAFDTLKFGEQLLLSAGARADHYKTHYQVQAICTNTATCGTEPVGTLVETTDLAATDTLFNWKVGGVIKPIESLSLYINYALSQQPPGGANFQLSTTTIVCPANNQPACTGQPAGTVVDNANANNPNLDPQTAKTLEAGGKWSVLEGRLALNFALFQTKVSNEINTTDPTNIQSGEKKVKGVEFSVVGNLTENWMISAGYSHLDTEVVEGSLLAQDGTPNLTYTPGDGITVWTSYRLPFGITFGGGLRHVGGMHRGTDGAAGTPTTTGGYGVVDAVVSYATSDDFSLRFNAYNVLDKVYVAAINKSGYRYTPGAPRTFLISADYRF